MSATPNSEKIPIIFLGKLGTFAVTRNTRLRKLSFKNREIAKHRHKIAVTASQCFPIVFPGFIAWRTDNSLPMFFCVNCLGKLLSN
jgi:hypothetical protein